MQFSVSNKSSVSDIEKQQLNNNNNILKCIKPRISYGPFYIFEVDNIIIIYNLLLSLLQKRKKKQQKGSFKP